MCELSPVSFHGDTIFCVIFNDEPYIPMRPIVANLELDWPSQTTKFNSNKQRWGVVIITTPSNGGEQKTLCLPLRKYPAWLASINPKKVKPELRAKIELYQNESDDALWDYWFKGKAERAPSSSQPDDRLSKRTDPERKQLTGIINAWVGMAPIHYATARAQVNAHFGVTGIDELTVTQVKEAIQWVQGKIDALSQASPETLPSALATPDMDLSGKYQSFLEEVERWRQSNRAEYDRLYRMAVGMLEPGRTGTAMTEACAAVLASWLKEVGLSHISVFDKHLDSSRAPVILIANLNARFESVEKQLKKS